VVGTQVNERGICGGGTRGVSQNGRTAGTDPKPAGALVQWSAVLTVQPRPVGAGRIWPVCRAGQSLREDRPEVTRDDHRHQYGGKCGAGEPEDEVAAGHLIAGVRAGGATVGPERSRDTTSASSPTTVSISCSVVPRPRDSRIEPIARRGSLPRAPRTCEGSSEPAV